MVPQKIIDTVARPMNSAPRQPGYLSKPEYSHLQEMNREIYASSAYYAASEMFEKVKAYFANMLNPELKYFVTDLPYMLSIKEGLLMREQIINEQSEQTFDPVAFSMERTGLFFGSAEDSLFAFNDINKRRIITNPFYTLDIYRDTNIKMPEKQLKEVRVLSVDVALLASKKHDNDASALLLHQALPTSSNNYIDNVVGLDTQEGLNTDDLGLEVMRSYYQYNCDYIALDTTGIGVAICDYLMDDRYDPIYSTTYPALNVVNDSDMSDRCKVKGAKKVIYSLKASARSNNDMVLALRAGFQNGNINLLVEDAQAETIVTKIRGYKSMTDAQKIKMKMPFVQTSLLINELVNLSTDTSGQYIKVKEKTGMRKDRYSSLMYGYYVVQELSKDLKPKNDTKTLFDSIVTRRGTFNGIKI